MAFIVIEKFDMNYPTICVDPEDGFPLIFDTMEEAQAEADECQVGQVVEI